MSNNDLDDFLCDSPNDSKYELKIEERDTERLKNELRLTGYRDAYQKEMENETCLQYGFDIAYKEFSRVGFLIGQIRSLGIYLDVIKNDSVFLSQIFHKLDQIESYSYDLLIQWSDDTASTIKKDKLNSYLLNLEFKLNKFKDHLLNSSFVNDFKQVVLNCLNALTLDPLDTSTDTETKTTLPSPDEIPFVNEFDNINFEK